MNNDMNNMNNDMDNINNDNCNNVNGDMSGETIGKMSSLPTRKSQNLAAKIRKRMPDMLSDLHSTISALSTIISVTAVAVLTIVLMVAMKYYFLLVVLALIIACEFLERYKKTEYDVFLLAQIGGDYHALTVRTTIRGRRPLNVEDVSAKVAKNEEADFVAILSYQKVDNN